MSPGNMVLTNQIIADMQAMGIPAERVDMSRRAQAD